MTPNSSSDSTSPPGTPSTTYRVLVVDDSVMDRHLAGSIIQKMEGWEAKFASNGLEALTELEKEVPNVVITDLQMPEMDGLELVQTIRSRYPLVPVILMTAHGSEEVAIKALQAGAASYVPKKNLTTILAETCEQVLAASQSDIYQQRIIDSLTQMETRFELENDTALVAPLVGFLEEKIKPMQLCEPGGLMLLGVALHEALTNAILHGNLELDSTLRETEEKRYYQLARERRNQEPYRDRRVMIHTTLTREEATFVIRDDGNGFDPTILPDPTDPCNLGKVSGRGLLLIHTFMDHVSHNDRGNEITMIKQRTG